MTFYDFILKFAGDHPFLFFVTVYFMAVVIRTVFIRSSRAAMTLARGWPPAHLDADGDWRPHPVTETETQQIGNTSVTTSKTGPA